MILRNYWYVAARADEVTRTPLGRVICNEPIVLYRTGTGAPVALRNLCSHRRAPLSKGKLVGDTIECPYHGLMFNETGRCVKIPSQDDIPAAAHIDSFPVAERWGLIWLWMGEAKDADAELIPSKPWRADRAWNADSTHYYHVKASHMLMTDNLLDLGHVAYIHADTIGFNAAELKDDPLVVDIEETTVRTTRIFKNIEPAPAVKGWGNFTGRVDRHSVAEWTPPCFTSIQFANRNNEAAVEFRIDHLITPETEATHHYWVLVSRNFRIDDDALTKRIHADNDKVAGQDMDIVEAQQQMIELSPSYRDMPIRQDKGLMAAHRILERLHRAERTGAGS